MKRREFLKGTALAGAGVAGATTLSTPAFSQGREKLTMVTSWGRGLAGVWDSAAYFAQACSDITGGTLEIELKAQGELVSGLPAVFDAATSGQADAYHAADYYYGGQHPAFNFFTCVPMGTTAVEFMNWYYHGGGLALHHELGEEFGLKSFVSGNTALQAGGWFRKEINSPEDFNGLKFRMGGLGGKVLGKLGASVQVIPGSEVYQALASGAIDGCEWIGPWADEKQGFQEITKIYYTSGFHEPGSALSSAINLDRWDGLSTQHQKAIEVASQASHIWNMTQFQSNHGEALARLKAGGVRTLEFNDSIWSAFAKGSAEVMEETMTDDLSKRIWDSQVASMKKTSAWIQASDISYIRRRNAALAG